MLLVRFYLFPFLSNKICIDNTTCKKYFGMCWVDHKWGNVKTDFQMTQIGCFVVIISCLVCAKTEGKDTGNHFKEYQGRCRLNLHKKSFFLVIKFDHFWSRDAQANLPIEPNKALIREIWSSWRETRRKEIHFISNYWTRSDKSDILLAECCFVQNTKNHFLQPARPSFEKGSLISLWDASSSVVVQSNFNLRNAVFFCICFGHCNISKDFFAMQETDLSAVSLQLIKFAIWRWWLRGWLAARRQEVLPADHQPPSDVAGRAHEMSDPRLRPRVHQHSPGTSHHRQNHESLCFHLQLKGKFSKCIRW